jgi:hypothetical protein
MYLKCLPISRHISPLFRATKALPIAVSEMGFLETTYASHSISLLLLVNRIGGRSVTSLLSSSTILWHSRQ